MTPLNTDLIKMPSCSSFRFARPRSQACVFFAHALALGLMMGSLSAFAGMDDMLKAVQQSDFSFARSASEVPFYPVAWAQDRFYPSTQFKDERGVLPSGKVSENTFDFGCFLPAYIAKRDMLVLGGDIGLDRINVRSGPYPDQSILRVTPTAAWLHQFGEKETVSIFAAPIVSCDLTDHQPWGVNAYCGVVGMHEYSDKLQLLYGGVYQYDFGRHTGYPYAGVLWQPSTKCSLSLVFPWPTFTYALSKRWLFQSGIAPGGSSWVSRGGGVETTQSFGSWNINAGLGYQLHKKLWLFGGAGMAGLRGVKIESSDDRPRFESKPSSLFTLALQIRP